MKGRIVNCTLKQLGTVGLRKLTMDSIAGELHISKRTIYQHFSSKDQLLEACLMEWMRRNRLLVATGDNLIDEFCTLYLGFRRFNLLPVVRCCRELRQHFAPVYRFFLERLNDYADACGAWAERDAEAGYLCRAFSPQTVRSVVSDFLIRIFGSAEEEMQYRSYLLSPEILLVYIRGLCTIKGRALLDQRLKTLS